MKQISESELVRRYIETGLRRELKSAEAELEREQAAQRDRLRKAVAALAG